MTLHVESVREMWGDLIPSGESESLVEFNIPAGVDSESSFRGYEKGLNQRGYDVITSTRELDVYSFRIRRDQND